ncbi:MAG: hypothetical protein EP297_03395 [Gammaproteobacteria bacterium]|nr:MAG: hypothetical protein EP297_03395 [Gammaproteobacteria bacterium]
MKKLSIVITLLVLFAVGYLLMQKPGMDNTDKDQRVMTDLPWIIETDNHGGSRVFGLDIGKSTIHDAVKIFSSEVEIGIFLDPDNSLSLEAYFDSVRLSGLLARVVLEIDATQDELHQMATRAIEKKAMPSNAWQFRLPNDIKQQLMMRQFISLSYMPKIDIENDILVKRFGQPDSTIKIDDSNQFWLYPKKGLVIAADEDGKELFQYVRPDEFERLQQAISTSLQ